MNNLNPKLRYALGISALSALSLAMVACGGSSSSAPAAVTNAAPSTPVVAGPTSVITLHPATYNLSAIDPEGDQITFVVAGATPAVPNVGPTSGSGSFNWTATASGAQTFSVTAKDTGGHTSNAASFAVNVAANRAPQFISQPTGQLTGSSSTINWTNFTVSAQDPDTDDVVYSVGTATFVDNNGGTTGISGAIAINASTGAVSFTGAVPSGATSVTATFTVTATDKLPGGGAVLGATSTQVVSLTYFNNNVAPVILTSSLPSLPLNHWIPIFNGGAGFALAATDTNSGDIPTLSWNMTSSVPGLVLDATTGPNVAIITNASFTPLTSTGTPVTVTVTVTDAGGLTSTRTLSIPLVADAVPTLNSNVYTETVSGVTAFDPNNVRGSITSRARFYPGVIDWLPYYWSFANYVNVIFPEVVQSAYTDALATDNAFSNYSAAYPGGFLGDLINPTLPAAGWNSRTLFKDNEGDGISYGILPNSVFVAGSGPYVPVGQPFVPGSAYPSILFGSPDDSEFPVVDATLGTIGWRPVLATEAVVGPLGFPFGGSDSFQDIFAMPTVWSFTVEATESVWNPVTSTYVPVIANKGQQNYTVKVQPNNPPVIGPLTTIPAATLTVPGALANEVFNPLSTISIGGGASTSATAYGRPSIQEPESRPYDITTGTGFDYAAANTDKPAVWRWLMAMPGGDFTKPQDVQMYDPDSTTQTGHQDAINGAMGTPTVPPADGTGNLPALAAGSVSFYNPWLTAGNAGAFQVKWGPNRTQYLIARVTASAAYSFPVEVRDQYERIGVQELNINPIFGTVRFTNARTRIMHDAAAESGAAKRGGTLLTSANPGDPSLGPSPFTFTYLPFPGDLAVDETDMSTFLFSGSNAASGTTGIGGAPTALYTAASWITLNAREAAYTSYHTGNPLNDEAGSFNLPAYASAIDGTSSASSRADWKTYAYDYTTGSNPTNPVVEDRDAIGSYANHEVRAQVIPSNSPYQFSFGVTNALGGYYGNQPLEFQGSTLQIPRRNDFFSIIPAAVGPTGYWYDITPNVHGWVYNLYQGEVDMQNAVAGRGVTKANDFFSPTTSLRFVYSWPTQVTQSNHQVTPGGANKWEKGDVMQIAVPNQGANARYFFVGDGSVNDPAAAQIYGWGWLGISSTVGIVDTDLVFGTASMNLAGSGAYAATNTPFHVPSNSYWMFNNIVGAGTTGFLNMPNRTTFSPGGTSTQLPFNAISKGYIDNHIVGGFRNTDPGYIWSFGNGLGLGETALIDLGAGDNSYFLWLKHDSTFPTAWGTWDASVLTPGSTYTVTGGSTTTPGFGSGSGMVNGVANSTLPASFLADAQISMASGNLPGQNHASNVDVKTDASMYNGNILNAQGFARNEWGLAAPTMGFQPAGSNNVRLVNPSFDSGVPARWNNQRGTFHTLNAANVSTDGGVRDSAIVYGVRRHTDENGGANAELGLAGIEPGSPLLAQWYNMDLATDASALDNCTVNTTGLEDVGIAWPDVFTFYSPFVGNAAWANVMEFKVNYLVGVTYPDANGADPGNVSLNTLWKVPSTMANVFELGAAVTDPSNTNPGNTINPGNPIVRAIQTLRISDFVANTTPGVTESVIDLVASNVTNAATGAGALNLLGNTYIKARSNVKVSFQASVNNQVIPSGYIVDLFQLTGDATTTNQPILLTTVRTGHIGGRNDVQALYMPSMHSYSGLDGNGVPANAVYFFRIRTVWHKGINFEKTPTKQSIPMAYADYISAPFVTN